MVPEAYYLDKEVKLPLDSGVGSEMSAQKIQAPDA
jgi:hypothetical protein